MTTSPPRLMPSLMMHLRKCASLPPKRTPLFPRSRRRQWCQIWWQKQVRLRSSRSRRSCWMQRRNWPTQKKVENLTRKLSNNMIPGHQGVILLNTIERRRGLSFLCLRGRLQHPTEIRWCKTDAKQENVSTMGSKDDPFSVVKGRCSDRRELMRDQGRCHH